MRTICMMFRISPSRKARVGRFASTLFMRHTAVLILLLLPVQQPGLEAQSNEGWNTPRSLELVRQARDLRQATAIDPDFQSYAADARGYVYFFLDRPDTDERSLVKTDQIALEVFWRAPDQTKQRLIGLRDEKTLPTNIKYHLDHLTVVQDDFGDQIRLGDGDEVAAVTHPVAPGAEGIYDFRLADSLTVSLPGPTPSIRVYELEVRPKNPEASGVIGSVFLQRGSGAIVRMNFTFTPASYVDDNLDYIRISMDNSVWDGKYWLPYRQEVELRRELPVIDFLAGSVIRGRFEIRNYQFNPPLGDHVFVGGPVSSVPQIARENFPFETGLYEQLEEEGLETSTEIESIKRQAIQMAGRKYVSGLRPSRLYVPFVSSIYRYNRAEGSFVGGGLASMLGSTWRLQTYGGYAFGRERGQLVTTLAPTPSGPGPGLRLGWSEARDASHRLPGASTSLNTLGGVFAGEDYSDPYFTSSVELRYDWAVGDLATLRVSGAWERHRSGANVVTNTPTGTGKYRPVLLVDEGDGWVLEADYARRRDASGLAVTASGRLGTLEGQEYASLWWDSSLQRRVGSTKTTLTGTLQLGLSSDAAPVQTLFLVGGRHTLPGYAYRSFVGDQVLVMRIDGARPVLAPWLSVNAFATTVKTGFGNQSLPLGWPTRSTRGFKSAVGLGLGIGWDLLHLEAGRGLRHGGHWEFTLSAQRRFWEWL